MDTLPTVSVIMPIRNEGESLRESLRAVLNQDYPHDLVEIVVADGMSDDCTRNIVREFQAVHPNLKLVDNPGRIVPTGMNAAIGVSSGQVIVRVDGHTIIDDDYVGACVDELDRSGADNVGGRMVGVGEGRFARAVALATSSPFGVGGARFHYSGEREWVDTVYLGAWRRDLFEKIGLFDEELVRNQDDELNYRLRDQGGRILLSPSIRSRYAVRATPRALFSQYFQYGFWKVRVMQKHPTQTRVRHFVPPAFVAVLASLAVLSPGFRRPRRALRSLLLVYGLCCAVAGLRIASGEKNGREPLVAAVFPILHLAYGSGVLRGLVHFARRWGESD